MRTDDLIHLLATQAGPAPRAVVWRRLGPVALLGLAGSTLLALLAHDLVPRDLLTHPLWWLKWAYAATLAAAAVWLTGRLARPAATDRTPRAALALALAAMALLGTADWLAAEPAQRLPQVLGHSWASCSLSVFMLSLPPLAGCVWALRGLAPTQLHRAGAAAGLCAGALGAMAYALVCEETAPSFVAVWYTLGIGAASLLGAWLGPRLLRW